MLPVSDILAHLGIARREPSVTFLDDLLRAWSERIPWESASRIARHTNGGSPAECALWPADYFAGAIQQGTGGTCFESNLAFSALVAELSFEVALSFCDMNRSQTVNPHCATVIALNGDRYLADVGYPVPGALRLDSTGPTQVETPVYTYHTDPEEGGRWRVWRESGSLRWESFALKTQPVDTDSFRARLVQDHGAGGLFLHEVIVMKAFGDELYRFSESTGLVRRAWGVDEPVPEANLSPAALADRFGLDKGILETALRH
jgi:arylamine N-acetyltransferase